MVFYKMDRQILPSHHNRSFYVTGSVHDVEMKPPLIDQGFSLNMMPLSKIEVVGIPRSKIFEQLIEVLDYGGNASFILDYINLDLIIGSR